MESAESTTMEALRAMLQCADDLAALKICKSFMVDSSASDGLLSRSVLADVDFRATAGEIVGLIGKTGVGKTTLGKILGGLMRPDSGSVTYGGLDIHRFNGEKQRELRRWIRYVPQNPDAVILATVSVRTSITDASLVCRLPRPQAVEWQKRVCAEPLFNRGWYGRQFNDLSLGEKRRVVNLRALYTCPRFLIMDEPFNGLDLVTRTATLELLLVAASEFNMGILLISHDVTTLKQACQQIVVLAADGLSLSGDHLPERPQ